MEGVKSGEVPKLPRNWPITQTDMTRWWKDFSAFQKVYGEKWVSYNATNEPIVCGMQRSLSTIWSYPSA